ncbi:hypothetical protein RZN25_04990 [Bacillaceae bacterium S4-13-56]
MNGIIQIKGKVKYPITLDPSVWIFDDRKVQWEQAFQSLQKDDEDQTAKNYAKQFSQALYQQKLDPPVNRSLTNFEKKQSLEESFVIPIKPFLTNAQPEESKEALLDTTSGKITIPYSRLVDSFLLFAVKGKPITDEGPVHLYFGDKSNYDTPIKGIQNIIFE